MLAVNIQRPRESSCTGDWCYNVAEGVNEEEESRD